MNLIDRDVNVLVLLVAMPYGDVLVLAESHRLDRSPNDLAELIFVERAVIGMKRNDQVVGAVAFDTRIRTLKGLDHIDCQVCVLSPVDSLEISRGVPGAPLSAFAPKHIGH
jgi:hypothetical protein